MRNRQLEFWSNRTCEFFETLTHAWQDNCQGMGSMEGKNIEFLETLTHDKVVGKLGNVKRRQLITSAH